MKKRSFELELALESAMLNYMEHYYKDREDAESSFEDDFREMGQSVIDELWGGE